MALLIAHYYPHQHKVYANLECRSRIAARNFRIVVGGRRLRLCGLGRHLHCNG